MRYVYDDFYIFLSVTLQNGDKIEYLIDGQNRRIGRKVNGIITNRWIYSGQLYPVAEIDSTGNIVSTFNGSYLEKSAVIYRVIRDHLGSIRIVMNSQTGEIVQRIEYDEWGDVIYDSNPGFQPFGYAGGIYDFQTRITKFGFRDYDPQAGRWISKDPIRFLGGLSNLYEYAACDPINYYDLDGLQWTVVTVRYNDGEYGSQSYIIQPGLFPIQSYNMQTVGDNGTELEPGIYKYGVGLHRGKYKALNIYNLNSSRTVPDTRTDGQGCTATGINVHYGNKPGSSTLGTTGCHVTTKSDWDSYIGNFVSGSGGFYIYIDAR
jgi:RHS repeat-associated protein